MKIGYDGIVIANDKSGFAFELTLRELYLALAKKVPHGKQMMDNPYMMWSDINPKLPNKNWNFNKFETNVFSSCV